MGVRVLVINILRRGARLCARGFGSAWGSFVWSTRCKGSAWVGLDLARRCYCLLNAVTPTTAARRGLPRSEAVWRRGLAGGGNFCYLCGWEIDFIFYEHATGIYAARLG